MQAIQTTISLRRVAALNFLQRLNKVVNIIALAACAVVVLYVAGYFLYEWQWPPVHHSGSTLFGYDDGRRAIWLVNPALRWLGFILFLQSSLQIAVAFALLWHDRPGIKRLIVGSILMILSTLFSLAGALSCGC